MPKKVKPRLGFRIPGADAQEIVIGGNLGFLVSLCDVPRVLQLRLTVKKLRLAGGTVSHRIVHVPYKRPFSRSLGRIILGPAAGEVVDHINGNPLDNRRENLRSVTQQVNATNLHGERRRRVSVERGIIPRWSGYTAYLGRVSITKNFRSLAAAREWRRRAWGYYVQAVEAGVPRHELRRDVMGRMNAPEGNGHENQDRGSSAPNHQDGKPHENPTQDPGEEGYPQQDAVPGPGE